MEEKLKGFFDATDSQTGENVFAYLDEEKKTAKVYYKNGPKDFHFRVFKTLYKNIRKKQNWSNEETVEYLKNPPEEE